MKVRQPLDYVYLALKGVAMGAADVVPGVSGGTIAFISGIYKELIATINTINPALWTTLKKEGFTSFWHKLNGNFLLALFSGIFVSVLSLAPFLSWLLENHPIRLWSFFFGLVVASLFFVGKEITRWTPVTVGALLLGTALAYGITMLPVNENAVALPYLFMSGALAICAMILPGISGAFILVLLGSYKTILDAVHERDLKIIATVAAGALLGLLSFARFLQWMFRHHKNSTLALLTGFILGSLNKIWPWKKALELQTTSNSLTDNLLNVWPSAFEGEPQLIPAILLAIMGFSLIFILEKTAAKK